MTKKIPDEELEKYIKATGWEPKEDKSKNVKGDFIMPTISMFYGILIRMFFRDIEKHKLPHIHAEYQGQTGVYSIPDGELLAGTMNPKKQKLIIAWIEIHSDDLLADWELAVNGKPLFKIKGLDQ